jgi:hypothetical protein
VEILTEMTTADLEKSVNERIEQIRKLSGLKIVKVSIHQLVQYRDGGIAMQYAALLELADRSCD